ncbi:hypothetical protein [Rhizobium sp. RU35A]|uniref:hypothetical protein n=1 Tax=Rhizobium sp. RU35A TaxID=1907414 RepID=UPI00122D2A7F|nr:hypothetical protein [Rhizobium sp. RU35A]
MKTSRELTTARIMPSFAPDTSRRRAAPGATPSGSCALAIRLEQNHDWVVDRRPLERGFSIKEFWKMARSNSLYLIIGALVVVVAGLGAYVVHEETKPKGVEMSISSNGVKVEQN